MERKALLMAGIVFVFYCFWTGTVLAETPAEFPATPNEAVYPKGYDGFQASRDAQIDWDSRRQDAINRQLGWNELFKARAATTEAGAVYYAPYVPWRWDVELDYASWPYAVGPIDGYGFYDAVRQPIGRREVQTGPNRWESFPIYAEDVEQPVVPLAPPKIEAPIPPPAPKPAGREF